jgi:hypothetical protein
MTTNNICENQAYLNAIDQRQRMAPLNIPPPRYDNLAVNPYNIRDTTNSNQFFTQYQLDMRRKVEILKYSSNRMSTQTNSLTKAQKYAQLVNGSYQQRTYSQSYMNKILADISNGIPLPICPVTPTPSTSCDIPGPAVSLFEDDHVPLYNLTNDTNNAAFGIINQQTNMNTWNYTRISNVTLIEKSFVTITTVYIVTTEYNSDVFTISVPLSANITATRINNKPYIYHSDLSFSIINAKANVLYSYSDVTLQETPVFLLNSNGLPSYPKNPVINLVDDISMNVTISLGILQIENLYLYTQPGYIYDIQLQLSYLLVTDSNFSSTFNNPSVTLIANPTGTLLTVTSINGAPVV